MVADMLSNKKLIVTKLSIRGTKLNIYVALITQSFFGYAKN